MSDSSASLASIRESLAESCTKREILAAPGDGLAASPKPNPASMRSMTALSQLPYLRKSALSTSHGGQPGTVRRGLCRPCALGVGLWEVLKS